MGVSPAQVRKDLAYFGEFGIRGVGYNVKDLHAQIIKILGLGNEWNVALIGLGNLGLALSTYQGFRERGFNITSIFDCDPKKVGMVIDGIEVYSVDRMEEILPYNSTHIGAITAPAEVAQGIADKLIKCDVRAILNFAPLVLNVPPEIELRNVDLVVNLEVLSFNIGQRA